MVLNYYAPLEAYPRAQDARSVATAISMSPPGACCRRASRCSRCTTHRRPHFVGGRRDHQRPGGVVRACVDDAVLPAGSAPMIAPTKATRRAAGADRRGSRRVDGHLHPHHDNRCGSRLGCRRRQRAGRHRSPLGQCTYAAPRQTAQPADRVPACRPSTAGVPPT